VDLRVGALEADVVHPLRPGEFAGPRDGGRGDVDSERAPCPSQAGGLTGRLPGPTSDIEDLVVGSDTTGPAQEFVVSLQFGVVTAEAGSVLARDAAPRRRPVETLGTAWALFVIGVHR
jgi:hypothetical protein